MMRIFNRDLRLQDVTIVYFTALAALMVILVASYQAPPNGVGVASVTSGPSGALPPLPMPFRVPLDPRGELHLAWNISYATQEIYMELRAAELKHGVLLGMSDRGQLTNADLVLLWNAGNQSYFGVRAFPPVLRSSGCTFPVSSPTRGASAGVCGNSGLLLCLLLIKDVIKPLIKNHSNCTNGLSSSGTR